jgi:hypothetical protein
LPENEANGTLPSEHVGLFAIALYDESEENLIWQARLQEASDDQPWHFTLGSKQGANIWPGAALVIEEGFFPKRGVPEEEQYTGELDENDTYPAKSIAFSPTCKTWEQSSDIQQS